MLNQLFAFIRRVGRGAWRPVYPLNPKRRVRDYIEYVSFRSQDVISAGYIFIFPLAIGFFLYEHYAANPKGMIGITAMLTALWVGLVWLAYARGR